MISVSWAIFAVNQITDMKIIIEEKVFP